MIFFSLLWFSGVHEVYEGFLYGVVGVIDEVE